MVKLFPALKMFLMPALAVSASMLVGTCATLPAHAQTAQFGMVDVGKVLNESKSRTAVTGELQRTQKAYETILQRLKQGSALFLSDAEINELAALYEKDKPTAAEQKRISQLEEKGDQQKRELTTLQNTPSPTEAQTARFTQLSDNIGKGEGTLQLLNRTLSTKLQDKARTAEQKALADVRTAVAKVAKAKGLAVVFTGDIAIYAAVDITDDVLKEVNK